MALHERIADFFAANPNAANWLGILAVWIVVGIVVRYNDRFFHAVANASSLFNPDARALHHINRISDAFLLFMGAMVSLAVWGVSEALWGALTALGVAGIIIGFATKDIATNFISGIIILFDQPFAPGDYVEVGSLGGTVESVNLRSSTLKTADGLRLVVPNTEFITKPVKNFSINPERRADVVVALAHESDLDQAMVILREEAEALPERIAARGVDVHITDLQEYRVLLRVRVWVERPAFLSARSTLQRNVTRRFIDEGIELAVPLRKTVGLSTPGAVEAAVEAEAVEDDAAVLGDTDL